MESTDRLAASFCDGSLPKAEWTHEAHLRVGLWHLLHHSPDAALDLLRERISRFNIAKGGENTDSAGYHETITRFYVWLIDRFLREQDRSRPVDELADALVQQHGDRKLPLRYWSKERLMSPAARRGWVEPDRAPLND